MLLTPGAEWCSSKPDDEAGEMGDYDNTTRQGINTIKNGTGDERVAGVLVTRYKGMVSCGVTNGRGRG
jgi:hypothetical protein